MNGAISILPKTYDVAYIIQKAGLFNHYGYETKEDGIHLVYPTASYEAVAAAIQSYEIDYLEVMLPQKLAQIDAARKAKVVAFDFMGMRIVMDTTTIANLTAAVVGLDRSPARTHINWQYGAGKFVTIPREMMYAMADAAFTYVQACFDHAMVLTQAALAATDIHEIEAIDVTTGWPGDAAAEPALPSEEPEEEPELPTEETPEEPGAGEDGETENSPPTDADEEEPIEP